MPCPGNNVLLLLLLLPTGILGMMGQEHDKARPHLPSKPQITESQNPGLVWVGRDLKFIPDGSFLGCGG